MSGPQEATQAYAFGLDAGANPLAGEVTMKLPPSIPAGVTGIGTAVRNYTTVKRTSMLLRVALEYGQT